MRDVSRDIRGKGHIDARVAELAARQHGVVARRQLRALGLGEGAIDFRIASGRLHLVFWGVYAVGRPNISHEGMRMAATLTYGNDAVLSHLAAAAHWPLLPGATGLHVTVPRSLKPRRGIVTHRLPLPDDEVTTHVGIRITTPVRTIFDLGVYGRRTVERAIHEAEHQRLYDRLSLETLLVRYPRRRGADVVRAAVGEPRPLAAGTVGAFEEDFVRFLEARGFPLPRVNQWLQLNGMWIKPACAWEDTRVIVELDGSTHATTRGRRKDHRRDVAAQAAGWCVMRVCWHAFYFTPDEVADDLWTLLQSRQVTFTAI